MTGHFKSIRSIIIYFKCFFIELNYFAEPAVKILINDRSIYIFMEILKTVDKLIFKIATVK